MADVMLKLCRQCGKEFDAPLYNIKMGFGIYCSRKCRGLAQSGKNNPLWRGGEVKRICSHCGKEFSVHPGAVKQGRGINCSIKCQGLSRKGVDMRGIKNPMFGKHHSTEYTSRILTASSRISIPVSSGNLSSMLSKLTNTRPRVVHTTHILKQASPGTIDWKLVSGG